MHEDNGRKQELPKTPSDLGKPPKENSQEPAAPHKETPAGDENMPLRERISDIRKPTDLTITGLAKALPYSWAEQEQIGLCL